jgi:hypothetical protein
MVSIWLLKSAFELQIILSEDDIEIKSKIYSLKPAASCFELYIEFSRCPVFSEFVFYFTYPLVVKITYLFFTLRGRVSESE